MEKSSLDIQNVSEETGILQVNQDDLDLVVAAKERLKEIIIPQKIFVASAVRTKSKKVFTGFSLSTTLSRASVCAESTAIFNALNNNEKDFKTLVIVTQPDIEKAPFIVSPCGICRELMRDYAPDINIILSQNGSLFKIGGNILLPLPYDRKKKFCC